MFYVSVKSTSAPAALFAVKTMLTFFFLLYVVRLQFFFVPLAMSAEMYSGHKYLNNGFLHSVFGAGFGIIGKLQMQIFRVAMGELVGRILNLELPLRCIHQHLCV